MPIGPRPTNQHFRFANAGQQPEIHQREHSLHRMPQPERRAKIAAAKLGVPRPSHVAAMLRTLQTGKQPTEATRAKMSQAHKQRWTRPPKAGRTWELWEDELLRTMRAKEVAERTGRTLSAVFSRRSLLGLEDGRTRSGRRPRFAISAPFERE